MNTPPKDPDILSKLPPDLQYLIEPVLRCGCRTEGDAFAFLDKATKQEMNELALVAERVLKHDDYPRVMEFLDKFKTTDYDESAQLYFFFAVLDHGGLKFDRVPAK